MVRVTRAVRIACNLRILGVERVRVFQLGETVVVLDVGVVDEGDPGFGVM